jgi:RNA polymerase sigma-70 factor, ECF subfamily
MRVGGMRLLVEMARDGDLDAFSQLASA